LPALSVSYGCLPKSWRFSQTRARFARNRARSVTIASTRSEAAPSRWGPFSHLAFTVIWSVSVVSDVGTAMFDTASGWLITSIDPNPLMVSLVQVAVSPPLFLFTLPAGALADVLDSRRLLIAVETAILAVSVIFAGLVSIGRHTHTLVSHDLLTWRRWGAHVASLGRHPTPCSCRRKILTARLRPMAPASTLDARQDPHSAGWSSRGQESRFRSGCSLPPM
jgi:hypothetical protein